MAGRSTESLGVTMSRVEFVPPDGPSVPDPTADLLRDVFSQPSVEYWRAGSADAGLHFTSASGGALLDFTYHPKLGFCVVYESRLKKTPLVLTTNPNDNETVTVRFIQNDVEMPRSHFVPTDIALAAAIAFLPAGEPGYVADAQWVEFSPREP